MFLLMQLLFILFHLLSSFKWSAQAGPRVQLEQQRLRVWSRYNVNTRINRVTSSHCSISMKGGASILDDTIFRWGEAHGVTFNKVAVSTFYANGGISYRGMIALHDIAPGEDFLSIPLRLALTTESLEATSISSSSWQAQLTVKLLQAKYFNETANGVDSLYLDQVLPRLESFRSSLPMFWSQPMMEGIKHDRIAEAIDISLKGHEYLREEVKGLLNTMTLFTSGNGASIDDDAIDWAICNVRTRNCRLSYPSTDANHPSRDFNALVPIFDLLNHSGFIRSRFRLIKKCAAWYINVCYDYPFHIKKGDQVFLNYGKSSGGDDSHGNFLAEEMLVQYGFIPPKEAIEAGSVDVFLPRSVTLKYLMVKLSVDQVDDKSFDPSMAVMEKLQDAGITLSQEFVVSSDEISADLMLTARLLSCKDSFDLQLFDAIPRESHRLNREHRNGNIVSIKHELESMDLLKEWLQDRLSAFSVDPGQLESLGLLKTTEVADYLEVQQSILRNALQLIEWHYQALNDSQV